MPSALAAILTAYLFPILMGNRRSAAALDSLAVCEKPWFHPLASPPPGFAAPQPPCVRIRPRVQDDRLLSLRNPTQQAAAQGHRLCLGISRGNDYMGGARVGYIRADL